MRQVIIDTDVLVAGGGLAGVCAAISAARHGARVVLLQDRSRLGGNSSSEVKMHVVGANSAQRAAGMARERPDRRTAPGRCGQQSAALLGVVGPAALRQGGQRAEHHAAARDHALFRDRAGRPHCGGGGALRQERAPVPHHAPKCSATARAIRGSAWKQARICAPAARRASEYNEPLAPEKPDNRTLGSQHPVHFAAVSQSDAVHTAHVGAQDHQGAAAFTARSRAGNTATGGSNGAATRTLSRTTSGSASSCSRS